MRRRLSQARGTHHDTTDESEEDAMPEQKREVTLYWRDGSSETRTMTEEQAREWELSLGDSNPNLMRVQVR